MGETINIFLDNLDALLYRLLQLPITFQMLLWFVITGLCWCVFLALLRARFKTLEKGTKLMWFTSGVVCSSLVAFGVLVDKKNRLLEDEMTDLIHRSQVTGLMESFNAQACNAEVSTADATSAETPIDQESNVDALKNSIGLIDNHNHDVITKTEVVYSRKGIQAIQLTFSSPDVVAYLAWADLQKFEIVLDTAISIKTKTSEFGKKYDAEIAINGEAGVTPGRTAPLGQWTGNYIVNGVPLLLEDSKKRPNLYFNEWSKGFYSNAKEVITDLTPEMYNCIWGRFDLIRNGKIDIYPRDRSRNSPYPRTVIGIDSTGSKVFLMVVDGRKPGYSVGMTMEECARVLLDYGVYSAMACDQGGSTTLYIKGAGVVNRPADGGERAVYTHFGLRRKS